MLQKHSQRGSSASSTLIMIIFIVLVAAATWAVYQYGGDEVSINGRSLDELELWEVVGAVVVGIVGLIVGLVAGLIGLLIGLVAMVVSLVLGLIGVAAGLFITAGVLLGPFLLVAAIILLMRRNKQAAGAEAAWCPEHGADCNGH